MLNTNLNIRIGQTFPSFPTPHTQNNHLKNRLNNENEHYFLGIVQYDHIEETELMLKIVKKLHASSSFIFFFLLHCC